MAATGFDKRGVPRFTSAASSSRSTYTVTANQAITTSPVVLELTEGTAIPDISYDAGTYTFTRAKNGTYIVTFQFDYIQLTNAQDITLELYDPVAASVLRTVSGGALSGTSTRSFTLFFQNSIDTFQFRVKTETDAVGSPEVVAAASLDILKI